MKPGRVRCQVIVAMAAAADKARFFLEQSVPELKEYEKKKIFNKVIHGELVIGLLC